MRRSFLVSLGLALTTAGTLAAQAPGKGTFDLGLFGRSTSYPSDFNIGSGIGFGGRLGYHFSNKLALEFDYGSMKGKYAGVSGSHLVGKPMHIRLAFDHSFNAKNMLILGAGLAMDNFSNLSAAYNTDRGLGLLLGLQHNFNPTVGLRVEGTYDKFGTGGPFAKAGAITGFDFGLNFAFGGSHHAAMAPRAAADADHDGVPDTADACPGTAAGTQVDARGCAAVRDADHDGVADASDACPATPAGTHVDARGCAAPVDTDHDGVADSADRCANTPAGTAVDANGCPKDTDGDGVADNADRCAGTAAGTPVDANGCPKDTDSDGVADNLDHCPGTPAGTKVDAAGCALPDTDADGVVDRDDKCPATPAGMKVDATGCQKLFDAAAGQTSIVLTGVTFRPGSAVLTAASRPNLDRVAEALVNNPTLKVEVQGHTDNAGAAARNRVISLRRANSVRAYLISKGVDGSRLTAKGYGPDQPKVPNTSAANRAQNRRVELKLVP